MKLIGSLTSPYVRKVRIVMAEKKLDYRLELENVWSADTQIQTYNPLGKVPCLVMEDGGALFDSRVIVEYVDTLSPVARLIPQPGRDRAAVKCWEAIADGLLDACVTIVKENQRPEAQRSPEWIERQYSTVSALFGPSINGSAANTWHWRFERSSHESPARLIFSWCTQVCREGIEPGRNVEKPRARTVGGRVPIRAALITRVHLSAFRHRKANRTAIGI